MRIFLLDQININALQTNSDLANMAGRVPASGGKSLPRKAA